MLEASEILFVGISTAPSMWYRCALPAIHIGADWVGVRGQPPGLQVLTGIVRGETKLPHYDDYRVVVVQQVYGHAWLRQIHALQDRGIKVLWEVDDYLHGVAKQPDHDWAKDFGKPRLAAVESAMRICDGIICSTEYIARRYAKFNRRVYVCPNGLDVARYQLTRPPRPTVNIGFAGGTGHTTALLPWLNQVIPIMATHEDTCFVSIGDPRYATAIARRVGSERSLGVPFCPLECYPAAMTNIDIALAPATKTTWYQGKSDLRWLEASALGIPVIADPTVYPELQHGVTGFHASTPVEMTASLTTLLGDSALRDRVGQSARGYVNDFRSSDLAAPAWFEVCSAVAGEYESLNQLPRGAA
jgi:glycosyltransferase involved in cell wall biosynthesis